MFLILTFVIFLLFVFELCRRPHKYPPGPKLLPFVGNSPELKQLSKKCGGQHIAIWQLAKQYKTDVLGLKLGTQNVVFVFSLPLIKSVLKSDEYLARPDSFFTRLRCMGTKYGITCADGDFWVAQKTFLTRQLKRLGLGSRTLNYMMREELKEILGVIDVTDAGFEMKKIFPPAIMNILWALTTGTRIERDDPRFIKLLDMFGRRTKLFDLSGGVLAQFPWLRHLFPEKSGYNLILEFNREVKEFFLETITEHYANWTDGRDDDLIYAFITEMKRNTHPSFMEDQLVMLCLDIFIAGAGTTSTALDFAVLMLALNTEVQEKVQKCLDANLAGDELPDYANKNLVPYVEAVLYELDRYCNIAPVSGPRRALSDTTIENYVIPKDTTVLLHNHSLYHDVDLWKDPEVFRPERFLDADNHLVVPDHFFPFNMGKRRCLGEVLARKCIFTFFTGIFKTYNVLLHPESKDATVDPVPGMILSPRPYKVIFEKRII